MLERLLLSFSLAVLGVFATTGHALAFDPTRDEMMIGTFFVVLGAMFLLLSIYAVKWYFGIDQHAVRDQPSPDDHH